MTRLSRIRQGDLAVRESRDSWRKHCSGRQWPPLDTALEPEHDGLDFSVPLDDGLDLSVPLDDLAARLPSYEERKKLLAGDPMASGPSFY